MVLKGLCPKQNHVLRALPDADYARLASHLEPVSMSSGSEISGYCQQVSHVYFPTTAIVSRFFVMENGTTSQVAMTGREGFVGVSLFLGARYTPYRTAVQSSGHAYRLSAAVVAAELTRESALQQVGLRYAQALITQVSQTAICNRFHPLSQQVCCWLLRNLDLAPDNELRVTQEFISNVLGVRREGVTTAAGNLQAEGLIRYRRGRVAILNRQGLQARACECYMVVKRAHEFLMSIDRTDAAKEHRRHEAPRLHRSSVEELTQWGPAPAPA